MSNVTETCSCGGTFTGDSYYAIGWRKNHRHECAPSPEAQQCVMPQFIRLSEACLMPYIDGDVWQCWLPRGHNDECKEANRVTWDRDTTTEEGTE